MKISKLNQHFTFSVDFRTILYQRLVDAIAHNTKQIDIAPSHQNQMR